MGIAKNKLEGSTKPFNRHNNESELEPKLVKIVLDNVPEGRDSITIQSEAMDTEQKIRSAYDRMHKMAQSKCRGTIFMVRIDGRKQLNPFEFLNEVNNVLITSSYNRWL